MSAMVVAVVAVVAVVVEAVEGRLAKVADLKRMGTVDDEVRVGPPSSAPCTTRAVLLSGRSTN